MKSLRQILVLRSDTILFSAWKETVRILTQQYFWQPKPLQHAVNRGLNLQFLEILLVYDCSTAAQDGKRKIWKENNMEPFKLSCLKGGKFGSKGMTRSYRLMK